MHKIDRRDLDCLSFDCGMGRRGYGLPPHPAIWGRHCTAERLGELLRAARPEDSLPEALMTAHLLYPQRTPEWARPWLLRNAFGIMGVELEVLERARWRAFSVPVADRTSGHLWNLLVGVGKDMPLVATAAARAFAPDSLDALSVVDRLVREKWGAGCSFAIAAPGGSGPIISGPSLGLPCFLAAAGCCEGLPDIRILSTGQLDGFGAVLPVEYVQIKVDSAEGCCQLFLYPQGSKAPVSRLECVPVAHVGEALAVMACYQPGMGLKIAQAEKVLQAGQGLAREICSFRTGMSVWLQRNRDAIAAGLASDPSLGELVQQLQLWCDSTLRHDPELGSAVLKCLSLELAWKVSEESAQLAWSIGVLQMDGANHRGSLVEFARWRALVDRLRTKIDSFENAGRHLTLYYVQAIIGDRHNRYVFSEELPKDEDAMSEIMEMEAAFELLRAKGRCRENTRLGRYYGTLGQNYGFCGPGFLVQCLRHLDLAISCFCADSVRSEKERNRDQLYKAFALSSAGRTDDAVETLRGITGLWGQGHWNLKDMNPYQTHALLRAHVDSGNGMDAGLWQSIAGLQGGQARRAHPWQLITYNLGLLAPDSDAAYRMLRESLALCLAPEAGPTIQVMALLPLAQLHAAGHCLPDMDDHFRRAIAPVYGTDLSREHFVCLIQAGTTDEILRRVQKEKVRLFPYSYR